MDLDDGLVGGSREEEEERMITCPGERWREEQKRRVKLKRDTVAMTCLWEGGVFYGPSVCLSVCHTILHLCSEDTDREIRNVKD